MQYSNLMDSTSKVNVNKDISISEKDTQIKDLKKTIDTHSKDLDSLRRKRMFVNIA